MTEGEDKKIPEPGSTTIRGNILGHAAYLTEGERDEMYGDPMLNLSCAGMLKQTANRFKQRQMSAAEQEAIDQCFSKIARIYTGPRYIPDTYIDLAAYAAIAGEAAARFASSTGEVKGSPEEGTIAEPAK